MARGTTALRFYGRMQIGLRQGAQWASFRNLLDQRTRNRAGCEKAPTADSFGTCVHVAKRPDKLNGRQDFLERDRIEFWNGGRRQKPQEFRSLTLCARFDDGFEPKDAPERI